ncbi:MAG: F0F1 ATP synthase subunit delta [Lachnospiraceae bacterium]|nr:F0F1 ATP synthase subunit delta [Lachnospiraceae bacterium]
MAKLITRTYGQALFELACENKKTKELYDEVRVIRQVLSDDNDLMRFMKHPGIIMEEKQKLIEDSLKGSISDELLGFLVILVQKERFEKADEILAYFEEQVNQLNGIGSAMVTSAMELTASQKDSIREKLLSTTGYKEMEIEYVTDASLIGGITVRVGDRVVDGSIKMRLNTLKKEMKKGA